MIRLAFFVVLLVVAAAFAVCGLRYRALPWQAPQRVDWCGATWDRDADHPRSGGDAGYPVTRQPPLIGQQFYSAYSPAQRARRGHGELARPCGGDLFTLEEGRRVPYVAPG